ncbi:MAG: ABC transporter ATP-binding protein [Planctomycetaceae bacterium]|nr:ABC transporter ATP-binding protein [Planctomycetaceae bacterium]
MSTGDYIVEARGLCKSFGKGAARAQVLRGLDLAVQRGEFVAVMGPSGCGKSTLLHLLGLMATPDSGQVLLEGAPVPAGNAARTLHRRRDIGFVFQRFNLLGTLSAADNIAISLRIRGIVRDGRAAELFEALGISHVARRKPSQMSIGEQQRVAVARALAHRPKLLLADEPTGNLDSANADSLLELFKAINRQQNQTIVMITHSAEAAAAADRVVGMKDGRIISNP